MLAIAQSYVKGRSVAEEVVQETWLAVIRGLDRFEGRSSLKTWIISILGNHAKTRGTREARSLPFASLAGEDDAPAGRARALPRARGPVPRRLARVPANWHASAETAVQDRETLRVAMRAIAELPPALPDSEVAQFEQHLELCEGCRSYVEQMRITIATVGRIDESDVPDELRAGLLAAFRGRPR